MKLVAALIVALIYVGSVTAGNKGVGSSTEVLALPVGSGPGEVGYVEANEDEEAWGPWSSHSVADMAMHASNELVHHGAELASSEICTG